MQAKLIKELEIHELIAPAELVVQCERRGKQLFAPEGTVFTASDCFRLVELGVAVPHDDECMALFADRTEAQIAATEHAARRLSAGIDPEDFARFDAGELLGYTADGFDIPGPNAKAIPDTDEDDE
jgi:hypothetical protein